MLPDTSREDALERAEALRQMVADQRIRHGNIELPPVTISLGVEISMGGDPDSARLLKSADEALYRAKGEGRNRVVSGTHTT